MKENEKCSVKRESQRPLKKRKNYSCVTTFVRKVIQRQRQRRKMERKRQKKCCQKAFGNVEQHFQSAKVLLHS